MGLFGNPRCPRCGRRTSYVNGGLFHGDDYYTCHPCNKKAKQEKQEKEELENRVKALENKLNQGE